MEEEVFSTSEERPNRESCAQVDLGFSETAPFKFGFTQMQFPK